MMTAELEDAEYRLLCRAVTDACRLLSRGDPDAGYRCLRAGLDRAREHRDAGEPWAVALAAAYRSALLQFSVLDPAASFPARRRGASRAARPGGPALRVPDNPDAHGVTLIPEPEVDRFLEDVDAALKCRESGSLVAGFGHLERGLERVAGAAAAGEPWAAALAVRYRAVIDAYTRRYGARLVE